MKTALISCLQQGNIYQKITCFLASLLLLSLSGCMEKEVAPVAVVSVWLNATSMEMTEGDTQSLTATISPFNADNQKIIWTSSDISVVSVKEGVVAALKTGKATITAKSDDGGKTATCEITVNARYPVESVSLDRTSVDLIEGDEITLNATVKPDNAINKNVIWNSSDPSVAEVVDGKVAALAPGSATITVKTDDGGKTAACAVKIWAKAEATSDYIDEYGINHGRGIVICGVVWAPVNCGYHSNDYQYGKLYQWGRKYGQGYCGELYVAPGEEIDYYSDASVPTIEEGGISIITGNHKNNENIFYKGTSKSNYDWLYPQDDTLWNSGSESEPVKTEHDPCPDGWRVPTYAEFNNLGSHYSSWTTYDGQNGCWFSGSNVYSESASRVFFPAAGYLTGGYTHFRGRDGFYWSSGTCRDSAFAFFFYSNGAGLDGGPYRESGFSVRCVQVTD